MALQMALQQMALQLHSQKALHQGRHWANFEVVWQADAEVNMSERDTGWAESACVGGMG